MRRSPQWGLAARHGDAGIGELYSVVSLAFILDPRHFSPSFNPALWSIGVEIAFSALFPLLVEVARRRGLARLLAVVLGLALAVRLVGISRYPAVQGVTFNSDMFVCRLDEFVIGMMLAQLYVAGRLPRRAGPCALAGVALVALAWIGFDLTLRGILPPLSRAILNNLLDGGLFLAVLAALVPGVRLRGIGAARALLSWRPLQLLGMMCYSLYIWHGPLLGWAMPGRAALPAGEFVLALAVFVLLALGVAAFSYRFIEFWRAPAWRPLFLLGLPARAAALS